MNDNLQSLKRTFTQLSDRRVLLAVSGGSDSVGMLHMMATFAPNIKIAVGFIDHGLREGTAAEFHKVKQLADDLNVEIRRAFVSAEEVARARQGGSIQAWARELRYSLLGDLAHQLGMDCIATAHTRDDQAETLILRMLRGTGLDGLGGIPPNRMLDDGIEIIRPMLDVTRKEIRDYLKQKEIEWSDDPSNEDSRYQRVRVRHEIIPLMEDVQPGFSKKLAALSGDVRSVVDFIEGESLKEENILKNLRLASGVKVEYEVFKGLPRGMWGRVVRLALKKVRGDLRRLERVHLEPIESLIEGKKSTGILPIPGDVVAQIDNGSFYVFSGPLPKPPTGSGQPSAIGAGVWRIRFAALGVVAEVRAAGPELVDSLEVRARRPGDKIWGSKRKLKEVLLKRRVPRPYRDYVPVLAHGEQIISCPMLISSRNPDLEVNWMLDQTSPFLDIGYIG